MSRRKPRIAETIQTHTIGGRVIQFQREVGDTYRVAVLNRPAPNGPLRVEEEWRGIPYWSRAQTLYFRWILHARRERDEGKA